MEEQFHNRHGSIIMSLNDALKSANQGSADGKTKFISEIQQFALKRSMLSGHHWLSVPDERWVNNAVVIMAHSSDPIRAIAVLTHSTLLDKIIIDPFRITFQKTSFHSNSNDTSKDKVSIDPISKNPQRLYSSKRGFWLVLEESFNNTIIWPNVKHVKLSTHPDIFNRMKNLWKTYIEGINILPLKEYREICPQRPHFMKEQYLLEQYPNSEWVKLYPEPVTKVKSSQKYRNDAGKTNSSGDPPEQGVVVPEPMEVEEVSHFSQEQILPLFNTTTEEVMSVLLHETNDENYDHFHFTV